MLNAGVYFPCVRSECDCLLLHELQRNERGVQNCCCYLGQLCCTKILHIVSI